MTNYLKEGQPCGRPPPRSPGVWCVQERVVVTGPLPACPFVSSVPRYSESSHIPLCPLPSLPVFAEPAQPTNTQTFGHNAFGAHHSPHRCISDPPEETLQVRTPQARPIPFPFQLGRVLYPSLFR